MLTVGDSIDLSIESVVYRGNGLGRHDGMVFFIPGTLPGERVTARVTAAHRHHAFGTVVDWQQRSPDRIDPCCRLASGLAVPGCVYDHVRYDAEVRIKHGQLAEFLESLGPGTAGSLEAPFPSPLPLHYRNKTVLHAQAGRRGGLRLGYLGEDNRTVVDLPACPLSRGPINDELGRLRRDRGTWRDCQDGGTITFRWTRADGVTWWRGPARESAPPLTEESPVGPLSVPAGGFYQVNPEVAMGLVDQVRQWVAAASPDAVTQLVDLYCGVGLFGLSCRQPTTRRLVGVENSASAVAAARANAARLGVEATFRCGDAGRLAPELLAAMRPQQTTVIVDPPRHGLDRAAAAALAATRPSQLIYVSCDPATLARDLRELLAAGYQLRAARLFDMFPRTAHFESAVWLKAVTSTGRA